MDVKIESTPLVLGETRGRPQKYMFNKLEVNQHCWLPEPLRKVGPATHYTGKTLNRKFSCRTEVQNGITGTRVLRVA